MAFLGIKELKELQQSDKIVEPFNELRIKNGAYELSLGSEVYLTDSKTGKVEIINANSNRNVDINPGQFALLLTEEKVNIPKDKIAFISIKAGEKLKGLVNVSGFHVDPGFNDHLLFSVYNAGPSTIVLNFGDPYFPIWFAEMTTKLTDDQAYNKNNEHYNKLHHIPSRYIEFLKRGELTSPKALYDKIKEVEEKKERNDWLLKILIGLAITIFLKVVIWDWIAYDIGFKDGKNSKQVVQHVKNEIEKQNVDSIISYKVDSILRKKLENDTIRKN